MWLSSLNLTINRDALVSAHSPTGFEQSFIEQMQISVMSKTYLQFYVNIFLKISVFSPTVFRYSALLSYQKSSSLRI